MVIVTILKELCHHVTALRTLKLVCCFITLFRCRQHGLLLIFRQQNSETQTKSKQFISHNYTVLTPNALPKGLLKILKNYKQNCVT